MNKFNQLGMKVLDFKNELMKNCYPKLIMDSLLESVDKLAKDGIIDVDVHYSLKEKTESLDGLKLLLLAKPNYLKTNEELFNDYEKIRTKLDFDLNISEKDYVISESDVENEKIVIRKSFVISEDFIKNYFYIESEKDFETLMKRKGFVEKFAILRLEKIFNDLLNRFSTDKDLFSLNHSNVFFDNDNNVYGIQLLFMIPIEVAESELSKDDDNVSKLSENIEDIITNSENYYKQQMSLI